MNCEWLIDTASNEKMQIRSTFRFELSPIRDAKRTDSKCWPGWEQKGSLVHCCRECKLVLTRRKPLWRCFTKLDQNSTAQPSCATLVLTPRTASHTSQMFTHQCIALPHTWLWERKRKKLSSAKVCRYESIGQKHSKQIKLISERQISHFSHLWFTDFHANTENHLCIYDVRLETNFPGNRENRIGR